MSDVLVGGLLALLGVLVTVLAGLRVQRETNQHQERMLAIELAEAKKREILHEVYEGLTAHYRAIHRGKKHSFSDAFESAANLVWIYCERETNDAITAFALMYAHGNPSTSPEYERIQKGYERATEAIRRELNPSFSSSS